MKRSKSCVIVGHVCAYKIKIGSVLGQKRGTPKPRENREWRRCRGVMEHGRRNKAVASPRERLTRAERARTRPQSLAAAPCLLVRERDGPRLSPRKRVACKLFRDAEAFAGAVECALERHEKHESEQDHVATSIRARRQAPLESRDRNGDNWSRGRATRSSASLLDSLSVCLTSPREEELTLVGVRRRDLL